MSEHLRSIVERLAHCCICNGGGRNPYDEAEADDEPLLELDITSAEPKAKIEDGDARSLSQDDLMGPQHIPLRKTVSLENLATCAICLEILFQPVTSPCGHHFCLSCLRRLLDYEGSSSSCPKCRGTLESMHPDKLEVNQQLSRTITAHYAEETFDRVAEIAEEDIQYQNARRERERRDHLLEVNPLHLMFENEEDPDRRRIMDRDVAGMTNLGFSLVRVQKALFVACGIQADSLNWLIQHQHTATADDPWSITELQEQMLIRNSRRALVSEPERKHVAKLVPGRFHVTVSLARLTGAMGDPAWVFVSAGLRRFGAPEIVIIIRALREEQLPADVLTLMKQIYTLAESGKIIEDGGHLQISGSSFLGDERNTGFVFTKHCGQLLTGLPVPPGNHLFGILCRGPEIEWAKYFPARLLLRIGRQFQLEFPFPLWSDRWRQPVFNSSDLHRSVHLASGLRAPGTLVMKIRKLGVGTIHIFLPLESADLISSFLDTWPDGAPIPILSSVARPADSHLVCFPSDTSKAYAISLPYCDASALGASFGVLVPTKWNISAGGSVRGDGLVMSLTKRHYREVIDAMRRSAPIDVPAGRGGHSLGLKIRWMPKAVLDAGVFPPDDREAPVHIWDHYPSSEGLHLPATATPRLKVLAVYLGNPLDDVAERVDLSQLHDFIHVVIKAIGMMLEHRLLSESELYTIPPSNVLLQAELGHDAREARYRISKTWVEYLPQAPDVSMTAWSETLHPFRPPEISSGNVDFQISLQIC